MPAQYTTVVSGTFDITSIGAATLATALAMRSTPPAVRVRLRAPPGVAASVMASGYPAEGARPESGYSPCHAGLFAHAYR
ncbi:hypothetical protein GCM10009739_12390 [Microbacterium ulmi]